jgi:hypothetical protein
MHHRFVNGETTNQLEIRFFGMKRSGNHAVISWMTPHFADRVFFINNVKHFKDPYRFHFVGRKTINTVDLRPAVVPKKKLSSEYRGMRKSCLLLSYEDLDLRQLGTQQLIADHDSTVGTSDRIVNVLLVRDHYNTMASRIQSAINLGKPMSVDRMVSDIELWLVYMREFCRQTAYVTGNTITVNYNRWFLDVEYRRSISDSLGRPFTDAGKERVPSTGDGSSFDGQAFDRRASEMLVLERWRHYADDEPYLDAVMHPDAVELSERVFDMQPPVRNPGLKRSTI